MQDLSGACFYANKHAIFLVSLAIVKTDLFLAGNGAVSRWNLCGPFSCIKPSVVFQLFNIVQLRLRPSERRPRHELSARLITIYIPWLALRWDLSTWRSLLGQPCRDSDSWRTLPPAPEADTRWSASVVFAAFVSASIHRHPWRHFLQDRTQTTFIEWLAPSGESKRKQNTIHSNRHWVRSSWNVPKVLISLRTARSHVQLWKVRTHIVVSGKINT